MKKGKDNTKKVIDVKDNFMEEEDNDKRVIIFVAIAILVIVGTIIGLLVGCEKKEEDDPVKPDNNKTTTPVKREDDKKDEDVEPTTKKVVVKKLSTKTEDTTKTDTKKLTVTFFMIDEKYSYMTEIENNSKVKAHEVSGYENCKYYTDETSNTEFDFTKNITKDTNIYMTCSLTTYTIKYDRTSNNKTSYTIKDGNIELVDGYDADMIFDGWYTDTAYTNKVTSLSPSIIKYADSENVINLYAKFVEHYTVSYYDEDNTLIESVDLAKGDLSNYTVSTDYSCPNDAKLLGYTSSLGSSVIKYANNEVTEITGNTNIYTKCGKATVIYVSEGETVTVGYNEEEMEKYEVPEPSDVGLEAPTYFVKVDEKTETSKEVIPDEALEVLENQIKLSEAKKKAGSNTEISVGDNVEEKEKVFDGWVIEKEITDSEGYPLRDEMGNLITDGDGNIPTHKVPVDENYKPTEDGENKLEAVWKEQEEEKTEVLTGETEVEGETTNEVVEPPTTEEPPVQETEVIEVPTIEEVPDITM